MNLDRNLQTHHHLSLLRWNLAPSAAALWQLATLRICQEQLIRATWTELEPDWHPTIAFDSAKLSSFQESLACCRGSAFVIGIERSNLGNISSIANQIRGLIRGEWSTRPTALIAWFPQADRPSMLILRELGFDLVAHRASSLHPLLMKIARC